MKNSTRRWFAKWILRIPGLVEAIDISENIKCAKAIDALTRNTDKFMRPQAIPTFPSWLMEKLPQEWAREEAKLVIERIKDLHKAEVKFEEGKITITFPHTDQPA